MNDNYSAVAIVLHWLIAVAVIAMLLSGLAMTDWVADKALQFKMYQWHKASGLLLMLAIIIRLLWRMTHKPPSLPSYMPALEVKAAHITHILFYVLLLAIPLTGWLMVSASSFGLPTLIYGWFEWPHIPGVSGEKWIEDLAGESHEILTIVMMVLIGLHIAALLKHRIWYGHNILQRMWFRRPVLRHEDD
jgi:cytochrome b561